MLDRVIIDHAAPTLARLKLGNLFNYTIEEGFHTEFAGLYGQLQEKGVTMAFDIGFFDWFLLCNAGLNFFPRFYPETKAVLGHHLFGYNWKTHLAHIIATFPVSVLLAWICSLFSGQ